MYFYWWVQQDLSCMGETLIFHEPCFIRAMKQWIRTNAAGIALAKEIPFSKHKKVTVWI